MALGAGLIAICTGAIPNDVAMAMSFAPILVLPILAFVFLGPLIVVFVSCVKGRPGYALGMPLLFVLAPVVATAELEIDTSAAHEQEFWDLTEPFTAPRTIILENESWFCREACLSLLAQRGDTVIAVEAHSTRHPRQYFRKTGLNCDPEFIAESEEKGNWRYNSIYGIAEFAAMGIVDACWDSQEIESVPDGIVVRLRETRLRDTDDIAHGAFHGVVLELIERQHGEETLLGRRIQGTISTHVPSALLLPSYFLGIHLKAEQIGSDRTKAEFFRDAFGVSDKPVVLRGEQLAASLEKLRQIVELSGQYEEGAMRILQKLTDKIEDNDARTAFPVIRRLMMQKDWRVYRQGVALLDIYDKSQKQTQKAEIDQLLRSNNPDDFALGLIRLRVYEYQRLAPEYEPAIERGLNSPDRGIVFAALVALGNKYPRERAFALPRVQKIAAAQAADDTFLENPLKEILGTGSN
jgi:hypothetical protein